MTSGSTTGSGDQTVRNRVARIANVCLGLVLAVSVGPLGSIMARLLDPTPGIFTAVVMVVSLFVLAGLPSDRVYPWLRAIDGVLFILAIALAVRTTVAISDGALEAPEAPQALIASVVVVLLAGLSALGVVASRSAPIPAAR